MTPELAKAVASWARKAREATSRRDQAIAEARAAGASLRDIAREAELSHSAVAKIMRRR